MNRTNIDIPSRTVSAPRACRDEPVISGRAKRFSICSPPTQERPSWCVRAPAAG